MSPSLPTSAPQAGSFRDLLDGDTWQLLNKLRKKDFLKRNLPDCPDLPPVHNKHLCSGFGEGGAAVGRGQDRLIPLTTSAGGGGVGIVPEQC
jgi:hypothetical protein